MKPIEIACRHQNADLTNCGADAGETCVWDAMECARDVDATGQQIFHPERIEDAASINEPGDAVIGDEALDELVDELGID